MVNCSRLLVVAAWEPELQRFRERLAQEGGPAGVTILLSTLGVGVVESAIRMTRCVDEHRPDAALLLGTAGALGAQATNAVVVASRVRLVDSALLEGAAVAPAPMPTEVALDPPLHDLLVTAGAKSVQIANTLGVTIDDALASRIARLHDVEHLEAFAFARACAVRGVPAAILLGIANPVGSGGRAAWLTHHASASAAAADLAFGALASIRTSTTAPSPERA